MKNGKWEPLPSGLLSGQEIEYLWKDLAKIGWKIVFHSREDLQPAPYPLLFQRVIKSYRPLGTRFILPAQQEETTRLRTFRFIHQAQYFINIRDIGGDSDKT